MKKLKVRKLAVFCSAFALMAGGALALNAQSANAYSSNFKAYDTDGDGYIEEVEYVDYSYNLIDFNNDGYINDTEWTYYTTVMYEPYEDVDYDMTYDFNYYDTDGDGYIEAAEYENAYDPEIYNTWDTDNDGYLEVTEYNTLSNTYDVYDYDDVYVW